MNKLLLTIAALFLLTTFVVEAVEESGAPSGSNNKPVLTPVKLDLDVDAKNEDKDAKNKKDDKIQDIDETDEESPGGIVPLPGEREPIEISFADPILSVEIAYDDDKVQVYDAKVGGALKPNGCKIDKPGTYYVEGIKVSATKMDVLIEIYASDMRDPKPDETYDLIKEYDDINLTVIKVKKITLTNSSELQKIIADGTKTPEDTDVTAGILEVKDPAGTQTDIEFKVELLPEGVTQADLCPDFIVWTGGVENGQLERKVKKDKWKKEIVSVKLKGATAAAYTMNTYVIGAEPTEFRATDKSFDNFDVRTSWDPNTLGLHYFSENDYASQLCEIEFAIKPNVLYTDAVAGLFDKEQIKWDVTRDKKRLVYIFDGSTWRITSDSLLDWESDDSPTNVIENKDNIPWDGEGFIYGKDGPGLMFLEKNSRLGVIQKLNMREWVRVGLGGTDPYTSGIKCSSYKLWHAFLVLRKVDGKWQIFPDFETEIKEGNIFWGKVPASSAPIVTPAHGVEVILNGTTLSWSVDYEDGVVSYTIEQNVNGTWATLTRVAATGENNAEYSLTVTEDGEYRIIAIDASGSSETFPAVSQ